MDRALRARVCSLSVRSAQPVIKVQVPCQPLSQRRGGRCGAKEGGVLPSRPKLGRWNSARNKTGQSAVNLLGEPPVEIPRVEELLRSLMQGLPPGLASGASGLREDLENNFRAVLRANLGKLDLAGRDEFDAQRKVLERTRARLEALEQRVAELEAKAANRRTLSSQSPPARMQARHDWTREWSWESHVSRAARSWGWRRRESKSKFTWAQGCPPSPSSGLPATAVKESKDRVRAALQNSGFEFPAGRITVNLSPADLPKEGCRYDLPIALGILLASAQLEVVRATSGDSASSTASSGSPASSSPSRACCSRPRTRRAKARSVVVPAANLARGAARRARRPRAARQPC